jgi:hypothetical protein
MEVLYPDCAGLGAVKGILTIVQKAVGNYTESQSND